MIPLQLVLFFSEWLFQGPELAFITKFPKKFPSIRASQRTSSFTLETSIDWYDLFHGAPGTDRLCMFPVKDKSVFFEWVL